MARVRGDNLKKVIKEGLEKLAAQHGKKYVYSPSELSSLINVSRPTLYHHADFIDEVLDEIKADRKQAKGHGVIEFMREKMERVEKECDTLKKELHSLRKHHAELYEKLYYDGKNLSAAIKPVLLKESVEQQQCVLCGQNVDADVLGKKSNVVSISKAKNGNGRGK